MFLNKNEVKEQKQKLNITNIEISIKIILEYLYQNIINTIILADQR